MIDGRNIRLDVGRAGQTYPPWPCAAKPKGVLGYATKDDWKCNHCGHLNHGKKTRCYHCDTPKSRDATVIRKQGLRTQKGLPPQCTHHPCPLQAPASTDQMSLTLIYPQHGPRTLKNNQPKLPIYNDPHHQPLAAPTNLQSPSPTASKLSFNKP